MLLSLSNLLNSKKHLAVKKIYNFKLLHAKKLPKIAAVKLSSCGLEVADLKKIAIAELRSCSCGAKFF
jgi:hypothetical protein